MKENSLVSPFSQIEKQSQYLSGRHLGTWNAEMELWMDLIFLSLLWKRQHWCRVVTNPRAAFFHLFPGAGYQCYPRMSVPTPCRGTDLTCTCEMRSTAMTLFFRVSLETPLGAPTWGGGQWHYLPDAGRLYDWLPHKCLPSLLSPLPFSEAKKKKITSGEFSIINLPPTPVGWQQPRRDDFFWDGK
jgi:hypothetical protein